VSLGRRGRLDYVNSAPVLPAFKPLPKIQVLLFVRAALLY
jgi:hypothetical protein